MFIKCELTRVALQHSTQPEEGIGDVIVEVKTISPWKAVSRASRPAVASDSTQQHRTSFLDDSQGSTGRRTFLTLYIH